MAIVNGRCSCRAVRYECGAPISRPTLCHCESCTRAAGASVVGWMTVQLDSFRIVAGQVSRYDSSAPVQRSFCGSCGTQLTYWHRESPDTLDITLASLDDPGAFAPADHTWMADAPQWDRPRDGLPQWRTSRSQAQSFIP